MNWKTITCCILLTIGAAGFLVTASYAQEAMNWHKAENWGALATVLFGQASILYQVVSLPVLILLSMKLPAGTRRTVLIVGCLLPVATGIAVYLGAG